MANQKMTMRIGMSNALLAGFAIGMAAGFVGMLAWRTRRRIMAEYRAIEEAELEARVDFATGYDRRIKIFEDYLEEIP